MIIYGGKASNIGSFDIQNSECDYCEQGDTQHVSVFGRYAHIFWIPMFPIGRTAVAECTHCKRTIPKKEFSSSLRQQYRENSAEVKRPFWHWFGSGLIGFFVGSAMIAGMFTKEDPRRALLTADEQMMTSTPTMESDSTAHKLKLLFDNFATDEINPSQFKYLTKMDGDKALVLVQIPKLRKVAKESRLQVLEMIEMVTNNEAAFEDKKQYIGVKGLATMMLIKTPAHQDNSRIALVDELLEYYGPPSE